MTRSRPFFLIAVGLTACGSTGGEVARGSASRRNAPPSSSAATRPGEPGVLSTVGAPAPPASGAVSPAAAAPLVSDNASSSAGPAPHDSTATPPASPGHASSSSALVPACPVALDGMACVPEGEFLRGSDDGPRDSRPAQRLWLSTFYMDRTEVTVEAYDACVARAACRPARTSYDDFSRPRQPKVGVSWFHADEFCRAQGKRLPTEAEWEKAARGADGRRYPWGDEPATCERAVIRDRRGRGCGVKKQGGEAWKGRTWEVASLPPNPYGLFDMAGNAWEWVADWYSPSYARCGEECTGRDPRGPCGGAPRCAKESRKVVRGGSWYWEAELATTFFRRPHVPENRPYHHYGFRCAASVAEADALAARHEGAAGSPDAVPRRFDGAPGLR